MHNFFRLRHAVVASAVALAVAAVAPTIYAAERDPCETTGAGVLPLNTRCAGRTYSDWSAAFWRYVLARPASTNPLLDATGAACRIGQEGPVFFLTGSDIGPVTRTKCVAPKEKPLFFPLVNVVDLNTPPLETPDQLRADIKPLEDGATNLHASIDGVAVPDAASFRVRSPVFHVFLPANNLFAFFGIPLASGTYLSVADGYYLMVAPLPEGTHTISFGGTDGGGFTQDITYRFTTR